MGLLDKVLGKKKSPQTVSYQDILSGVLEVEQALFAKYQSNHVEHYIAILAAGARFYKKESDVSLLVQYAIAKAAEEIANPLLAAPIAERRERYEAMAREAIRMFSDYRQKTHVTTQKLSEGIALYCEDAGKLLRNMAESAEFQSPAKPIYDQVLKKYGLPPPEEYFAVLGVLEFLTLEPMQAAEALSERINEFHDETGIPIGESGSGSFEDPFKELLEEYQKAMARKELSLKDIMLFLAGLEKKLEKQARQVNNP